MEGLRAYLATVGPFDWSGNNCLAFVSRALAAMGRDPLPEGWTQGYATPRAALAHYRRQLVDDGSPDIIAALDRRFDRELTLHPEDGAIIARPCAAVVMGYAFGVAIDTGCVFLTKGGPIMSAIMPGDIVWGSA